MQVWLFQALPTYKLVDEVPKRMDEGDSWDVSQHWNHMKAGDKVILWQSDPEAGIYAIGQLSNNPYPSGESENGWRVDIKYEQLLKQPILKSDLSKHPILCSLFIIKMPHGKNPTRVQDEQWRALEPMLSLEMDL